MNHNLTNHTFRICCFVGFLLIASCNLINPDERIPARVQLNAFDLQTSGSEGSDRDKITEVWVYADADFLGVYAPPVEFPFFPKSDQTHFKFYPGIRNNGLANDPIIYPLYDPYEITLNTLSGFLSTVNPVTHYKSEAVVSLNADFETSNDLIDNRDTFPATVVTRTSVDPFEGEYSGEIVLTKENPFIEVGNAFEIAGLPVNGKDCYLEFRYKSEMDMSVGILGVSLGGEKFSNFFYLVKPTENWNMLYIELTDVLKASGFPAYKILFRSIYPSNATKPELRIQLDNIKVVHL